MNHWYYEREGQRYGPVSKTDLIHLFEIGQLTSDALVWSVELEDWMPAGDVQGLVPPEFSPPPLPATCPRAASYRKPRWIPSGKQVRPWVRFFARALDMNLYTLALVFVLVIVGDDVLLGSGMLFKFAADFSYIFVESAMLALWGATPGKALLCVRVRRSNGEKLSYGEALTRAFRVWFRGRGMGIPIVTYIPLSIAYDHLQRHGITSWDADGEFVVSHQQPSAWRIILVVLILLAILGLAAYGISGL